MPQNVLSSVGLDLGMLSPQPRGNSDARAFSLRNCINHLPAAIGAIPTCKKFWVGRLTRSAVNENPPTLKPDISPIAPKIGEKARVRALPDRQNDQVCFKQELRACSRN